MSKALLNSRSPDDAVLAILCRSGDTRQTIWRILARIAELDPAARSDAATRLAIFAPLRRAETLLRQLRRRHGAIPQSIVDRVYAAGNDDLDQWTDAVLDAPNLDAIFGPSKH